MHVDTSYANNVITNAKSALDLNKIDLQLIPNLKNYLKVNLKKLIKYSFLFITYEEEVNGILY